MLEVSYRSVCDKRFVNPGLLRGPYLPLYGTGALILLVAVSLLQGSHVLTKALAYFLLSTGLELGSGFIARYFFHADLWDYSDQRFNLGFREGIGELMNRRQRGLPTVILGPLTA